MTMTSICQTRTPHHGGAVVRGREESSSSGGFFSFSPPSERPGSNVASTGKGGGKRRSRDGVVGGVLFPHRRSSTSASASASASASVEGEDGASPHLPHQCNSFVSSLSSTSELSCSDDDEPLEGELLGLLGNNSNALPVRRGSGGNGDGSSNDGSSLDRSRSGGGDVVGVVSKGSGGNLGEFCEDGETAPTAALTSDGGNDRGGGAMMAPSYYHDDDDCEAAATTAERWELGSASASYSSGTGASTTLGGYETALSSLARCGEDRRRTVMPLVPVSGQLGVGSPPFLPAAFASPPPPVGNRGVQGQQRMMSPPPPPPPPQESPSPFLCPSPSKGSIMPSPAGSVCSSVESFVRKMAATPQQPKQQKSPAETSGFPSPSSIGRRMRRLSVGGGSGVGDSPTRRSWSGDGSPRRSGSDGKSSGLSVPLPPRQQFCPPSRTSSLSRSCSVGSSISACSSIDGRIIEGNNNPPLPPSGGGETKSKAATRGSGTKMVGIRRRFFGPAVDDRSRSGGGEEDATSADEDSASASFHSIESSASLGTAGGGSSFRLVPTMNRRVPRGDRRRLPLTRQRSMDDSVSSSVGLGSVGSGLGLGDSLIDNRPSRGPERECRRLRRHNEGGEDPFRSPPPPVPRTIVSSSPLPPPNAPRPTPQTAAAAPSFDSSSHGHGGRTGTGGDQARLLPPPPSSHRGRHRRVLSTAATPPRGGTTTADSGLGSSWAPPSNSPSNHHRRVGSEPAEIFSRLLRDQYGTSTLLGEDGDVDRKMARGACHRRGPSLSIGGGSISNRAGIRERGVYCGMEEEGHHHHHHHPDDGGGAFPPQAQARMRHHHRQQPQQHPLEQVEPQRPHPHPQRQHPLLRHSAPSARLATPPRMHAGTDHHRSASASASLPPPVLSAASFSSAASGSTGPGKRRSTMEICEQDEEGGQPRLVQAASSFSSAGACSASSSDFFGEASCHKRSGSQLVARELKYIVGKFSPMPLLRGVSGGSGGDVKLRRAKGCLT